MRTPAEVLQAEQLLRELAETSALNLLGDPASPPGRDAGPNTDTRYRMLVEQIPAVIFMADLEQGVGQAYVSPRIEETLGFTQAEWLEDPVRWYQHVHPEDKARWSIEAADLFVTGKPLRSHYRVLTRAGRVVWFQCEARMMRHPNGRPWFIHGIGVDITDLKRAEQALEQERNVISAILDAVGTLVIVLDPQMRIVRFNRVSEEVTGYKFDDIRNRFLWDLIRVPEQSMRFRSALESLRSGETAPEFESAWDKDDGSHLVISWSITSLRGPDGLIQYFIAAGTDITERKRLESEILEVSSREQRRIGQDLHDGLGQMLTGIAFLSKVHEQNLEAKGLAESKDAAKLVGLVNDAIRKSRDLARGLMPIFPEPRGLMTSLEQMAREVEDVFGVICHFECRSPVLIHDPASASHLYYIAREAIHNGVKHGKAPRIEIILSVRNGYGSLVIHDSGSGLHQKSGQRGTGMGLRIMAHRAGMIGGSLEITSDGRGTTVACHFPTS